MKTGHDHDKGDPMGKKIVSRSQAVETIPPSGLRSHVVGIGSSAGGLEALSQFVSGLPGDLGCFYVIAQHMSSTHKSMMAEILARETKLLVKELSDGEVPVSDVVYIVPPAYNLVFASGRFSLRVAPPEVAPKPSINEMFRSMADEFGEMAIGIILSGTGSDGTKGLQSIKTAGGVTFVQIPETAKYDGMPRSAIDAGVADRILSPEQIGQELERLIRFPGAVPEFSDEGIPSAELSDLFERVRQHTKIDFSSYKLATVQRRLQRRLLATESNSLVKYLDHVALHPEELEALAKETLISVTEFFRDKDAYKTLARFARELAERKDPGEAIRVWVAGCATGEEAYSLAILFLEAIAEAKAKCPIHIFATDIDNNALTIARHGHYSQGNMAEMPVEYVGRYFIATKDGFEPTKELRGCITFARQDMSADPPFLKVDLVSCRNVLIYFNPDLQAKVLSVFHYAMRQGGLLFLGRSESVTQQDALFSAVDRRARIFRSLGHGRPVMVRNVKRVPLPIEPPVQRKSHEQLFLKALADHSSPAILVDGGCRILHSHGAVAPFINFPAGVPDMNLAQLIVPEFANEILSTLYRVRRNNQSAHSRKRRVASLGRQVWRLAIHPLEDQADVPLYLVMFEDMTSAGQVRAKGEEPTAVGDGDEDLAATKEHLQTLMEEMAASNEEMQALNEEIQAANEELQATNEELEASNEELHATNEELVSVNEESQVKSSQLVAINNDFASLYNTLEFPILVFDPNLSLIRANTVAERSYNLPLSYLGLPIDRLNLPRFLGDIGRRLEVTMTEQRRESFRVEDDDRNYQIFLTPTINRTRGPQSVVLVVIDQTELVQSQKQSLDNQQLLLSIMNHSASAVSVKDTAGRYEFGNARFSELFGLRADDIIGKTDHQLFSLETAQILRGRDLAVMAQLQSVASLDRIELASGALWLDCVRFPIYDGKKVLRAVCTQATDFSAKLRDEQGK